MNGASEALDRSFGVFWGGERLNEGHADHNSNSMWIGMIVAMITERSGDFWPTLLTFVR